MNNQPLSNNYREILPEIWGCVLFDKIRNKQGEVYGKSFLNKQKKYAREWIINNNKTPGRSNIRLRSKNQCSYCQTEITAENGVGDHVVGRKMNQLYWLIPCCRSCNSSKGKKDLLDWWVNHKNNNITILSRDVISIFVRAKYRLMEDEGSLDESVPSCYEVALKQIKDNWDERINSF